MRAKRIIIHKNRNMRKPIGIGTILALASCFLVSCSGVSLFPNTSDYIIDDTEPGSEYLWEGAENMDSPAKISIDISEHYITNTGDPSNLFYIDSQGILWGSGENRHGQLGLGAPDEELRNQSCHSLKNTK